MEKESIILINTTNEHKALYSLMQEYCKHIDGLPVLFKEILDDILTTANTLSNGNTMTYDHDELIKDIVFKAFGNVVDQYVINMVDSLVSIILNYYTFMLIDLHVGEKLLYLDDINNNGIMIASYNNDHMRSISKENRHV